jgi:hypothetical protein
VSGPVLDLIPRPVHLPTTRQLDTVREACFTAGEPPLLMGCAMCGHPPYAHGCSAVGVHDYEVPSAELMAERLGLYVALGLHRRRMSEAEFRREHVCAPERVEGEVNATQGGENPLSGCAAASPATETGTMRAATHRSSGVRPPVRGDVHRVGRVPVAPSPGCRWTTAPQPFAHPSGVLTRTRLPRAARAHAPDALLRPHPHRGRLFPPNPPNPPNLPNLPDPLNPPNLLNPPDLPDRPGPAGRQQHQQHREHRHPAMAGTPRGEVC